MVTGVAEGKTTAGEEEGLTAVELLEQPATVKVKTAKESKSSCRTRIEEILTQRGGKIRLKRNADKGRLARGDDDEIQGDGSASSIENSAGPRQANR
jgi:hypothetical protein